MRDSLPSGPSKFPSVSLAQVAIPQPISMDRGMRHTDRLRLGSPEPHERRMPEEEVPKSMG